ncbi:hypothetical protein D5R81_05665 [Parashewanella spongiae]|uniref:Ankyrin repeat domain-containing protein n=1 Tax=Parashewanella spongiae TaxID=342950 RepID=A0A3A6TVL3_9GAMM|nr:ankyrin repeat domain-containing protein [Parashewanella spongiae]MCL1077429.1 ankyrin repeat domain-containing protein [Parashewanella spongiae]RJY18354.1 hypothetical protein D5R81_05665 [Parashewanella spongiae]
MAVSLWSRISPANWLGYHESEVDMPQAQVPENVANVKCFSTSAYANLDAFLGSGEFDQFRAEYINDIATLERLAIQYTSINPSEIAAILLTFKDRLFDRVHHKYNVFGLPIKQYRAMAYGEIRTQLHTSLWYIENDPSVTTAMKGKLLANMVVGLTECIGRVQSNVDGALQTLSQERKGFDGRIRNVKQTIAEQIAQEFLNAKQNKKALGFGSVYHIHFGNYLLNCVAHKYGLRVSKESGLHHGKNRVTPSIESEFKEYIENRLTHKATFDFLAEEYTQKFHCAFIEHVWGGTDKGYYDLAKLEGNTLEALKKELEKELLPALRTFTHKEAFGLSELLDNDSIADPVSPQQVQFNLKKALAVGLHLQMSGLKPTTFSVEREKGMARVICCLRTTGNYFAWLEIEGEAQLATFKHLPIIAKLKCSTSIKIELLRQALKDDSSDITELYRFVQSLTKFSEYIDLVLVVDSIREHLIKNQDQTVELIKAEKSYQTLKIMAALVQNNEALMLAVLAQNFKQNFKLTPSLLRYLNDQIMFVGLGTPRFSELKAAMMKLTSPNLELVISLAMINDDSMLLSFLLEHHTPKIGNYLTSANPLTLRRSAYILQMAFHLRSEQCFNLLIDHPKINVNQVDEHFGVTVLHKALDDSSDEYAKWLILKPRVNLFLLNQKGLTALIEARRNGYLESQICERMTSAFSEQSAVEPSNCECLPKHRECDTQHGNLTEQLEQLFEFMQKHRDFKSVYSILSPLLNDDASNELKNNIDILLSYWLDTRSELESQQMWIFLLAQSKLNFSVLESLKNATKAPELEQLILQTKAKQHLPLSREEITSLERNFLEFPESVTHCLWPEPCFQQILIHAISQNNLSLVKTLLHIKPTMNCNGTFETVTDKNRYYKFCTPLMYAMLVGNDEMCALVLSIRPQDMSNQGGLLLTHSALNHKYYRCFEQMLLVPDIDWTARDTKGRTALQVAMEGDNNAIVKAIALRSNVNIFATDISNNCCLDKLSEFMSLKQVFVLISEKASAMSLLGKSQKNTFNKRPFAQQLEVLNDQLAAKSTVKELLDIISQLRRANNFHFNKSQSRSISLIFQAHCNDRVFELTPQILAYAQARPKSELQGLSILKTLLGAQYEALKF